MSSSTTTYAGDTGPDQRPALLFLNDEPTILNSMLGEIAQRCDAIANKALGDEPVLVSTNSKDVTLFHGQVGELCAMLSAIEDKVQEIDRAVTRLARIA